MGENPGTRRVSHKPRSSLEWILITLILLIAGLFRFHDLGNIPKGLEHDEVATWHMVTTVLEGERPIYFEEGYGHEPLYNYLTALTVSLWGHNWLGERFWAPWLGMLAVAATYALMRRLYNPLVGLSAAGFQATVLWALFFNRLGLRLNLLPFLLCVAAYCFWRGVEGTDRKIGKSTDQQSSIRHSRLAWFAAAGALIGACLYTYMSSRVVPLIFGAFSVYLIARDLWIQRRERGHRGAGGVRQLAARWWPLVVCFAVASLVMAPLALYLLNRPQDTATPQREGQVDRPLSELVQGNPRPVIENVWALAKMWNLDGERYWQLNYSHRPVFVEPISGLLFWIGLIAALWYWKEPRSTLLILWIALGMVPSLLTSEAPSWPRTMLASPAALALPAIGVWTVGGWAGQSRVAREPENGGKQSQSRERSLIRSLLLGLLVLSHLLTAVLTYRDFLVVWPRHPRVRYAFQSSLTEALRYLDRTGETPAVVMAGLSPHDMDSWTERSTLQRRDLAIRRVDARSALVLPAGEESWLVTLDITPVDPALADWANLDPEQAVAQGEIVPRGGTEHDDASALYYDPAYTIYRLDLADLQRRIEQAEHETTIGDDPFASMPLDGSPQFDGPQGGLVRLLGYEWLTLPRPGEPGQLLSYWQALDTGPRSAVYGEPALRTYLHLLDGEQNVVAGVDVLGAAPDTWQAGDTIVQLHALTLPDEPGTYAVEMGWYVPPNGPRLPAQGLLAGRQVDAPGQRILLSPVEVRP
jgi:hypothetical protein